SRLAGGNAAKPEVRVFKFRSPVKGAFVGHEAIYVLAGGKMWMISALEGETGLKVEGSVDIGGSQVSLDTGGIDAFSAYDGETLRVYLIRNASVVNELTLNLPGFESAQIHVSGTDVSVIAQRGSYLAFYHPSGGRLVLEGYLRLPVRPVWFNGYVSGHAYVTLWGSDGVSYMLRGKLSEEMGNQTNSGRTETTSTGSSRETVTSTGTTTETTTGTSTRATMEAELKRFLKDSYSVYGIVYSLNGYDYRGIRLTPKTGRLYYYPYGDDDSVYLVSGRYVLRIAPWDGNFFGGDRNTPVVDPEDQTLIVLPAAARLYYSIPNGDNAIMVDSGGKLHVLVGLREVHGSDISWNVFMSNAVYDFDAEGLGLYTYGKYVTYIAWRGNELRLYVYDDDEDYEMHTRGANLTVRPRVYRLPGRILEVNPYLDPDFLVIRTDEGTYVLPTPYGHYGNDTNVYRIDGYVRFIGFYSYGGINELIAYSGGRLYTLEADYSEYGKNVTVKKGSFLDVSNVVGVYGASDQDEYVAVSEKDGTLKVYQRVWNSGRGRYEFVLRREFSFKAPFRRFVFDYRPEHGWMRTMGTGSDGSFYIYEVRWNGG
ncbi:MAG: hypothetical protein GXO14_00370, partial [Thermococci archaeon]|nr:hypothetical protein [Thermococci archaeon]